MKWNVNEKERKREEIKKIYRRMRTGKSDEIIKNTQEKNTKE